jgi:hypothetical protein
METEQSSSAGTMRVSSPNVRLGDLLKDGDIRANVAVMPGDVDHHPAELVLTAAIAHSQGGSRRVDGAV